MKKYLFLSFILLGLAGCAHNKTQSADSLEPSKKTGYLSVNGIEMYYEVVGAGDPLVLIHGGGSSINVSFGKAISELAKNHQVIAIDEQGHGRTKDFDRPLTFENTAGDVAEVLKQLKIEKADVMGFSNGATTALYFAIRHPKMVRKLVLSSPLYRRDGASPAFWDMMKQGSLETMPQELKDAYVRIAPNPTNLKKMYEKDRDRMLNFKDIPNKAIQKVNVPTLVMVTDQDVPTLDHATKLIKLLPKGRLVVFPGTHDNFLGDVSPAKPEMTRSVLTVIEEFLLLN